MAQLKLIALDADDLAVISAHVQDARVRTSDIIWRQGEKRLVIGMSRMDWEQTLAGQTAPRRLIAALRFDRVLACKSRKIDLERPEIALELLGIEFNPTDEPGGSALLLFSQGIEEITTNVNGRCLKSWYLILLPAPTPSEAPNDSPDKKAHLRAPAVSGQTSVPPPASPAAPSSRWPWRSPASPD